MRSIAMRATLIIAVLLIAGCGDRSTTTSTPTPTSLPVDRIVFASSLPAPGGVIFTGLPDPALGGATAVTTGLTLSFVVTSAIDRVARLEVSLEGVQHGVCLTNAVTAGPSAPLMRLTAGVPQAVAITELLLTSVCRYPSVVTSTTARLMSASAVDKDQTPFYEQQFALQYTIVQSSTSPTQPTPVPTPTPAPTPTPMPTLPPNCVRALTEPPADAWPLPATGRLPAAIRVSGNNVYGISIDPATGSLDKKTSTLPFGARSVIVTPNGDLAYVLHDHCVQPLRVNGLGQIAPGAACVPIVVGGLLDVHPTRRLLYMQDESVCCPDHTSAHTFRVSLDGTLYGDEITAIPWGTGRLLIHPNGVFAYRGHSEYCIGTSGAPELVATFPSDTPDLSSAAFDASGRYLVTSGPATYRIDSQTGLLSLAASGPERTPGPVAAHPSRDLVFVCPSSGDVDTYRLDRDTGALTFLAKHPASYSSWGGRLDVEPSGRFLYLQNDTGLEDYLVIEGFRIESDGSLTEAYYTEDWESARKLAFFLGPPF